MKDYEQRLKKLEKEIELIKLGMKKQKLDFDVYGKKAMRDIKQIKEMVEMLQEFFISKKKSGKETPRYIG